MKKTSKSVALLLCVCLSVGVLLAGCGQKSSNNTPTDAAKMVTIPTSIQPCYNSVPMDIAGKKGYYKSFGVDAPMQVFTSGGPQNEALAAGKWDIGMLGMAAALSAIRYDAKIIAVADYEGAAIKTLVRKDSDILKVIQFDANGRPSFKPGAADVIKGKTIVTTVGTSGHYGVQTMLKALGLTFSDVKILNMDQPSAVAAFKAGQGDMATVWSPYTWPLLNEGAVSINDIAANGFELPAVILVRGDYYKNPANRDAIKNWLKSYFKGIDDMKGDKKVNLAATKEFLKDNGYDPTDKQLEAEVSDKPLFNLQQQIDLFNPAKGKNGMGDVVYQFSLQADYLVDQKAITKEQRDTFVKTGFTDEFLKELAAK